MAIIQLVLSAVICGVLYVRMVRREVPETIGKGRAVAQVALGVVSLVLSFIFFIGVAYLVTYAGIDTTKMNPVLGSIVGAFIVAGLPEELAKLLIILLTLLIFRSKIRNVYEVILVGAGIGLGFTMFEEFAYGGGGANFLRLFVLAAHMVFGILMTRHIGQAWYNRVTKQGSPAKEMVLAVVVPMLVHTLYDSTNAANKFMNSEDETTQQIGVVIGLVGLAVMFAVQIVVLVRLKKNTEKYCAMSLRPQDGEAPEAVGPSEDDGPEA